MREIIMITIYSAIIGGLVSFSVWYLNYFFITKKDRKKADKNLEKVERKQVEDNERIEKQFALLQGKESLIMDSSLINGNLQVIEVFNEFGEHLTSMSGSKVSIEKKLGWISKIFIINSCFKDEENPIVDNANYIRFRNEVSFSFNEEEYYTHNSIVSVLEKGNEIVLTCKNVINYYADKDWRIFYQFYLVMGSGGKNFLLMFGSDKVGNDYFPFLLGKEEMISTINTVNNEFRFEYQALREYLEKQGIKIS